MKITASISKAARALLNWKSIDLAEQSGVSHDTIRAFESGRTKNLTAMNEKALADAFTKSGLELIPENGGGAGLRYDKPDQE
ncbi:MAG: helix-turn-helix domain-containing protein [Paracoccaceae bacterium]